MTQHLTTETLIDYMHGALTPQEDAAVYAHLETCTQCRSEYDAETSLTEALRSYAAQSEQELPPSVKAEIWNRVREARPSPLSRLGAWLRPAVAIPAVAVLAVGAYFGTSYLGTAGAPSIDAAYYLQDHAALNGTMPFSDRSINPVDLENESSLTTQRTAVNVQAASYTADANP